MIKKSKRLVLYVLAAVMLSSCSLGEAPLQRRVLCQDLSEVRALIGEDFYYPAIELYPDVTLYEPSYYYTLSTKLVEQGKYVASGYEIELSLNRDYVDRYGRARLRGTIEEPEVDEYDENGKLIRKPAPPREETMQVGGYTIHYSFGKRATPEDPAVEEQFYAYYSSGGVRHSLSIAQLYHPYTTLESLQEIATEYFTMLLP